uniref:Saposin B-type domain-containing protein n=2 Tax=Caenorhabditis tropicalis TaxID=1561998 RepID=A0A1I7USC6_9PELO
MMAESIDEAMFTFPNLASPDQATLFKPPGGYGGGDGGSSHETAGDENPEAVMPMSMAGPSVMTTKVSIAAFGAGTPLDPSLNGECPTYACMSCKMSLLNGFLANPNIGAADNATLTAQRNALALRLGTTQGSCDQQTRRKRFSEHFSKVNKHKVKKRLAKRFVIMNTTPDSMNDDGLDTNTIDENDTTDSTTDPNGAKNKPPVLGVVTSLGCQYRRGEALEANSEWCGLCNLCWQWRKLPSDYYPNYLNEVNCDHNDDGCLSGFGECKPIMRTINVMRQKGDEWVKESIDTTTGCECQVEIGSSLHGLVVK